MFALYTLFCQAILLDPTFGVTDFSRSAKAVVREKRRRKKMTRQINWNGSALMATLLMGAAVSQVALAQPPPREGGGGGSRGGRPGGFGGPGQNGRPPMGGMRRASVVQVPVSALTSGLTLTETQVTQIKAIQDALRAKHDALMPRPGGDNGTPPDRDTMQANMDLLRKAAMKAEKDILALLTDKQKTALPGFLKLMDDLREVGIPAEVYAELNLTSDQKTRISAIAKAARPVMPPPRQGGGGPPLDGGPGGPPDGGFGGPPPPRDGGGFGGGRPGGGGDPAVRRQAHEKAMALLTDEQKQIVTAWMDAHPRPPRGGGFGGGRPGEDGPPPPRDGNGPPPDGENEAPPPPAPGE